MPPVFFSEPAVSLLQRQTAALSSRPAEPPKGGTQLGGTPRYSSKNTGGASKPSSDYFIEESSFLRTSISKAQLQITAANEGETGTAGAKRLNSGGFPEVSQVNLSVVESLLVRGNEDSLIFDVLLLTG